METTVLLSFGLLPFIVPKKVCEDKLDFVHCKESPRARLDTMPKCEMFLAGCSRHVLGAAPNEAFCDTFTIIPKSIKLLGIWKSGWVIPDGAQRKSKVCAHRDMYAIAKVQLNLCYSLRDYCALLAPSSTVSIRSSKHTG